MSGLDNAKIAALVKSFSRPNSTALVTDSIKPAVVESPEDVDKKTMLAEQHAKEIETAFIKESPITAPQEVVVSPSSQPPEQQQPVGAVIEYPGLPDLQVKIASLDQALKANHPAMDSLLQTIHRNLQKDPELVHLLKPEDTAIIFHALQNKTQTKIVQETVKSASSGRGKGLKDIGMDELGM